MIKKAKKTNFIYKKIKRNVLPNKRENIIALGLVLTCVILVSIGAYIEHAARSDKERAVVVRAIVASIKNSLGVSNTNQEWEDDSRCTIVKPRLFGDEPKYSCTSQYKSSNEIADQADINATIDRHRRILASHPDVQFEAAPPSDYPTYANNLNLLNKVRYQKLMQVSTYSFTLRNHAEVKCHIGYELTYSHRAKTNGVVLAEEVGCFLPTKAAYFKPIEEL